MTLNDMVQDITRRTNYNSAPGTEVGQRLVAFLNETLQDIISEPGMGAALSRHEPVMTFASVASQAVYGLPETISRIDGIQDRANDHPLIAMDPTWYRMLTPDPSSWTGTPSHWVDLGFSAVAIQPSNASRVFVDSTSASDVQVAFLEGIRTGGYPQRAQVTLTGVTAIDINTATTDWIEVTKFYLSAPAIGTITLHEDASGGTELARIPIGSTFSRYRNIALYPTPSAAITYYVDSERPLPEMIHADDEPPLPARFHRVLIDGARAKEYEKRDDDRYLVALKRYQRGVSQLRYFLTCPPDFLPVAGHTQIRYSRFGSMYPAD